MVKMANYINNIITIDSYDMLGTGNSWGQVASQTPENIKVTRQYSDRPILEPLLGYSKNNIINVAKKIGTFDLSICGGTSDCCVMYLPKHPVLKAKTKVVDRVVDRVGDLPEYLKDNNININVL
jgi:thiamine biosynthesis protein ThiI